MDGRGPEDSPERQAKRWLSWDEFVSGTRTGRKHGAGGVARVGAVVPAEELELAQRRVGPCCRGGSRGPADCPARCAHTRAASSAIHCPGRSGGRRRGRAGAWPSRCPRESSPVSRSRRCPGPAGARVREGQPAVAVGAGPAQGVLLPADLEGGDGIGRGRAIIGEEAQGLGLLRGGIADEQGFRPGGLLTVVEFAQVEEGFLDGVLGARQADTLDHGEVTILFAVFAGLGAAEKHATRRVTRPRRRAARGRVFTTRLLGPEQGGE